MIIDQPDSIAIVNNDGNVFRIGDDRGLMKLHSAAKPFQMLSFLRRDYNNPFGLTECERVLLASSHFGQDIHIAALESIMIKTGIDEEQLILPYSEPYGALARYNLRKLGAPKRKLFHQCSGKHLGFILRSKEIGADESSYHLSNNPVQLEALDTIKRFVQRMDIKMTNDNCGVPTYYVNMTEVAAAYMRFVSTESLTAEMLRLCAVYVEGEGALATDLMREYPVIAKSSANGVIAIGYLPTNTGIAIKSTNWDKLRRLSKLVLDNLETQVA